MQEEQKLSDGQLHRIKRLKCNFFGLTVPLLGIYPEGIISEGRSRCPEILAIDVTSYAKFCKIYTRIFKHNIAIKRKIKSSSYMNYGTSIL